MKRRTVVVDGPLAFRTGRAEAARRRENGLQIMTMPAVAARLAGGFLRPPLAEELERAVRSALESGKFSELEKIRQLPGMTRAVVRTLRKVWDADIDLSARSAASQ